NPSGNSPDISVTTLTLSARSIGTGSFLQTQVSNLTAVAGAGGGGDINITNGVSAPVTLNIGSLQATNAAGGTITLINNGTINDRNGGIFATGAINITASGATADLNTGLVNSGINSNTGSVNLTVGRDVNL